MQIPRSSMKSFKSFLFFAALFTSFVGLRCKYIIADDSEYKKFLSAQFFLKNIDKSGLVVKTYWLSQGVFLSLTLLMLIVVILEALVRKRSGD